MTDAGAWVDVIFLTRGELGTEPGREQPSGDPHLAQTREQEARQACRILGAREVDFLGGADGRLHEQPHLADTLARLLAGRGYRRIFAPWPGEAHPDHVATAALLGRALAGATRPPEIWLYEVWTPLVPNMLIPIDTAMEAKRAAIGAHASQLAVLNYLAAFEGLAAYRALFCPPSRYAEAFRVGGPEVLPPG